MPKKPKSKIRRKIISIAILIPSLIIISLFLLAFSIGRKSIINSKINENLSITNTIARNIEKQINLIRSDAEAISKNSHLQKIINNPDNPDYQNYLESIEEDFAGYIEAKGIYDQLRYINEEGIEIIRVDYKDEKASIIPKNKLQNKSDRDYFIDSKNLKQNELYVSRLNLNLEGTPPKPEIPYKPVIRYAFPIFSNSNQFKGILISNILAEKFIISQFKQDDQLKFILIDSDGYYLDHPESQKKWGANWDLDTGENFFKDFPPLSQDDIKSSDILESSNHIFTISPIKLASDYLGKEIYLLNVNTKSNLTQAISQMSLYILTIAIFVFSITYFFLQVAIGKIVNPILQISQAAKKVALQESFENQNIKTGDEIEELAENFNIMTSKLQQSEINLKIQVEEKTKKLTEKTKELEETLEDFYTIRISMAKDIEEGKLDQENQEIRKRIDKLKVDSTNSE